MVSGLKWTKADYDAWAKRRLARPAEQIEATAIGSKAARTGMAYAAVRTGLIYGRLHPLIQLCIAHGLPEPRPEYAWHPARRYRADYALVNERILIEIDGGLFIQGGHSRGAARLHDMEKDREATMLGWRTLRYPPNAESQIVADLKRMLSK